MNHRKPFASLPILLLLMAASLLFGCSIPAFYDWSGADQSRPAPVIGHTAIGVIVGAILLCTALPWLPIEDRKRNTNPAVCVRFNLRTLLAITSIAAVVIAGLMHFPMVVSGMLSLIAFSLLLWFWVNRCEHRWAIATLLACMFLPYTWMFTTKDLAMASPVGMIPGLPSLLPGLLIAKLIGRHVEELSWLLFLWTSGEVVLGIWLIRLGPKRTIAYMIFLMLISTFGSLALNMLVRI